MTGCMAVKNGNVKRKGKPSIEWYNESGKPQYYCLGYIDIMYDELLQECRMCKQNVIYAENEVQNEMENKTTI